MNKPARTVADLPRRAKRNFTRVKKCSRPKPKSLPRIFLRIHKRLFKWWQKPELNRRHKDFQSSALPTELFCQLKMEIVYEGSKPAAQSVVAGTYYAGRHQRQALFASSCR
jgi:hypothetical protein